MRSRLSLRVQFEMIVTALGGRHTVAFFHVNGAHATAAGADDAVGARFGSDLAGRKFNHSTPPFASSIPKKSPFYHKIELTIFIWDGKMLAT